METLLMILVALLPLGLVALSAYLLIKRKMRKKPELALVPQETVEKAAELARKTQGASSNLKKSNKKRSGKGKRK